MSDQFKDRILDLLGISFNIKASEFKDPDARNIANRQAGIKSANEKKNEIPQQELINLISKEIDYEIQKNNEGKLDDKKQIEKKENSIKSLSIYDIMKHSSGNRITDGVYKANHEMYINRLKNYKANHIINDDEFENCKPATTKQGRKNIKWGDGIVSAWLAYDNGSSPDWFKDKDQSLTLRKIKSGEILTYKEGDVLFLSTLGRTTNGPSKIFEDALFNLYGGKANLGSNDAGFDGASSGKDISIKAYKKGNPNIELDANILSKLQSGRQIKLEVYEYESYSNSKFPGQALYKLSKRPGNKKFNISSHLETDKKNKKFKKIPVCNSCILVNSGIEGEREIKIKNAGELETNLRAELRTLEQKQQQQQKLTDEEINRLKYIKGKLGVK